MITNSPPLRCGCTAHLPSQGISGKSLEGLHVFWIDYYLQKPTEQKCLNEEAM